MQSVDQLKTSANDLQRLLLAPKNCPPQPEDIYTTIGKSPIFAGAQANPMSFLSSRLSQFTKATRIFASREFRMTDLAGEFHQACDNIPTTLVIIKSGQYIAGGYTEVAWTSPILPAYGRRLSFHTYADKAFLFSVNRQRTYGLVINKFAMYSGGDNSARFGEYGGALAILPDYVRDGGVSDLYSYDVTGVADRYTELMGAKNFKVDEYEVYKLE